MVPPGMGDNLAVKVRYALGRGSVSPKARVSVVRRNLKEAGCRSEELWRAKFRADEQKPHTRPNRDGRVCRTKQSPMLPESHTVNEAAR
jgi:hypothetical protein